MVQGRECHYLKIVIQLLVQIIEAKLYYGHGIFNFSNTQQMIKFLAHPKPEMLYVKSYDSTYFEDILHFTCKNTTHLKLVSMNSQTSLVSMNSLNHS